MLTRSINGLQNKKENEDEELEQLLIQSLRTYELIDKIEEVEEIIRKVLVKPFIAKVHSISILKYIYISFFFIIITIGIVFYYCSY